MTDCNVTLPARKRIALAGMVPRARRRRPRGLRARGSEGPREAASPSVPPPRAMYLVLPAACYVRVA